MHSKLLCVLLGRTELDVRDVDDDGRGVLHRVLERPSLCWPVAKSAGLIRAVLARDDVDVHKAVVA